MNSDSDWIKIKTRFTVDEAANVILGITQPDQSNEYQRESVRKEIMISMSNRELEYEPELQWGKHGNYIIYGRMDILDGVEKEPPIPIGNYWRNATIAREDLAAWCEERNYRPAFLFPNPSADKPLHESERKTLLSTIRALAELHGVKPILTRKDGDGWNKAAESLLTELQSKAIDPPSNVQTLTKHLRAAFSSNDS